MDGFLPLIIAISVFSNIAIIKWKFENNRLADAFLDLAVLIIIGFVFMGTISGLTIGTLASSMFSLYLLVSPPKMPKIKLFEKDEKDKFTWN